MRGVRNETAVCVVVHRDRIILLKRVSRNGDPWSGDMCFPGGYVKDEETPREAAFRELSEEAGIDADGISLLFEHDLFHPVRFPSINVHPFVFRSSELKIITPGNEIERGSWYKMGDEVELEDSFMGKYLRWDGDLIWGLTYRIYSSLSKKLRDL